MSDNDSYDDTKTKIEITNPSVMIHHSAIQPIEHFNFNEPENWEYWLPIFQVMWQFRNKQSDEGCLNQLYVTMGIQVVRLLQRLGVSEEDRRSYNKVVEIFTRHFLVKHSTLFYRYSLSNRKQHVNEKFNSWVANLQVISAKCRYAAMHDELLRNVIIAGMLNTQLAQAFMSLNPEPTLENMIAKAWARESAQIDHASISSNTASSANSQLAAHVSRTVAKALKLVIPARDRGCRNCGREFVNGHQMTCPARNITCKNCHHLRHFANKCRSRSNQFATSRFSPKPVNLVSQQAPNTLSNDEVNFFIGSLRIGNRTAFKTKLSINGVVKIVKIDTSAQVSVLPESEIPAGVTVRPSNRQLIGAGNSSVVNMGTVALKVSSSLNECLETFYVIKDQQETLIGEPAIVELHLVSISLGSIASLKTREPFVSEFPGLFRGLGRIPAVYEIQMDPMAQPYAVSTARNVPIPVREVVACEIRWMQALGVISPVHKATRWCTPMVIARKANGAVRICTDFTQLNRSIVCPCTILPEVETSVALLGRAQWFTKLDANSGFWQIPLSPSSSELTTFITPFGRFAYNRLPFCICSTPEFFQSTMNRLLKNEHNVICHMDDIVIFAIDRKTLIENTRNVLRCLESTGVTLNIEKCEFAVQKIKFLGQIIENVLVRPDPDRVIVIREFERPTTITGVCRLLGMINQMTKFIPNLAEKAQLIREFLKNGAVIHWDAKHQEALELITKNIANSARLLQYDLAAATQLITDASNRGL